MNGMIFRKTSSTDSHLDAFFAAVALIY